MKTILLRKTYLFALLASAVLFYTACSKNNSYGGGGSSQMYTTSGDASGAQQSPPVTTTGTASLVGTYNATTNAWQYSINWTSLSSAATVIEFHGPAAIGVNGNLVFSLTITAGGTNGAASGTVTLTDQQEADLLSGKYYYTIIDATHITGEVRGQVYTVAQ